MNEVVIVSIAAMGDQADKLPARAYLFNSISLLYIEFQGSRHGRRVG